MWGFKSLQRPAYDGRYLPGISFTEIDYSARDVVNPVGLTGHKATGKVS